jgi:hypothetical protein
LAAADAPRRHSKASRSGPRLQVTARLCAPSRLLTSARAARYSCHGLDLRETAALLACLPESFDNDPHGVKLRWREDIVIKLKDLLKLSESPRLGQEG